MNEQDVLNIARDAIFVLIKIASPVLIVALTVGLIISLLQAVTQIQETTVSFVPKMLAVLLCLIFSASFIGSELKSFSERLAEKIIYQN
jgi:flagellar biosynthesis protein FliQ